MILHWLKSALFVVALEGAYGVVAVQKMVTEDYRPWYGDSLINLAIVRGSNSIGARIIEDSPEVRSVLSRYGSLQRSSTFASERVAPDPNPELVHDLEGYPHFEVIAGAHCKVLANTGVRCRGSTYTSTFVKVRITSGRDRRKEGLVCDAEIARTVAFP